MFKRKLFVPFSATLSFLILSIGAAAQYGDFIRSARPGNSHGAFAVGDRVMQMQTGISGINNSDGSPLNDPNQVVSTTVLRYGILSRLEASAVIGIRDIKSRVNGETTDRDPELSQLDIGGRYCVRRGGAGGPIIGLQARARLPVGMDSDNRDPGWVSTVAVQQGLSELLMLTVNLGAGNSGYNSDVDPFYTLNLSLNATDRISVFGEMYGNYSNEEFFNYFDGGIGWIIHEDFKLDISAGVGINANTEAYSFVDGGISFRLDGDR